MSIGDSTQIDRLYRVIDNIDEAGRESMWFSPQLLNEGMIFFILQRAIMYSREEK